MTKVSPEQQENEIDQMASNVYHLEDDTNSVDSDSKSEIDLEANSSNKDTASHESKIEENHSEKEALNKEQNTGVD